MSKFNRMILMIRYYSKVWQANSKLNNFEFLCKNHNKVYKFSIKSMLVKV